MSAAHQVYSCTRCSWVGNQPSSTEEKALDDDQLLRFTPRLLCPECFQPATELSGSMASFRQCLVQVTDITPRPDPRFHPPSQGERLARLAHLEEEIRKAREAGLVP